MDERFPQPGKKPMLQVLVGGVQPHPHYFPSQLVHAPALAGKNENIQHNNPKDDFTSTPAESLKISRFEVPSLC
jgi:hypothetical protein